MAAPSGTLATQGEPGDVNLRNRPVLNHAGGYVFKIDDLQQLERYLIIGTEGGTFYVIEDKLEQQNVGCLDRIITSGNGKKAVRLIEDVSINRRNVKQTPLLKALAICARCNDKETRTAAYKILPAVCRIPTFLFEFIILCQRESAPGGKGWGRAHKKAISEWYKSFKDDPEKLARYIIKFKNRKGWSHKDVLRLAHVKVQQQENCEEIAFIFRYIIKGLDLAKEMYLSDARMDDSIPPNLQKVSELLTILEEAMDCHDENHLVSMIRENKLTWEQIPTQFLKSAEVWKMLLPHMGIEALVKNLGRMTFLGVFPENSEGEETVLRKIKNINHLSSQQPQEDDDAMETDSGSGVKKRIGTNFYHPFKLLIGLVTYKAGKGEKGKLIWTPNQRIVNALDEAFYKAFEHVESTGKKHYLAIDVSGSMSQPVLGASSINCATAAAAMMMLTVKIEENTIIKGFSHVMRDIDISPDDKLDRVMKKVDNIMMGSTDCALPMKDAMERRIRDVDVFVVYTDNETWAGNVHPHVALQAYRDWSDRKEAKLIVCGMCSSEFTIADKTDKNMLDIVGFDSTAPKVISMFASGKLCSDDLKI